MVGRGSSRVPERWTDYIPLGRRIPGTRFIAFKVPLKESFDLNLHPEERFSPRDLVRKIREQKEELGLVIDLTHTTRYYRPEELPATLSYSKISTVGHEIPNRHTVFQFRRVVKKFLRNNKDNDKLIGVHCTHGLNRTGYLVCRYLIDVEGMEPNTAIELFNRARGHPIERINYIQDLQKRSAQNNYRQSNLGSDPFRERASAAPNLTARLHPHRWEPAPFAMPRRGGWAQAQPPAMMTEYSLAARNCWLSLPTHEWRSGLYCPPQSPLLHLPQKAPVAQKQRRWRRKPAVMVQGAV
ncbi:RNA/RNP complex-1-interacting phosphatase isoform X2 [Cuculus canorus]|uniref:RNA/RNP complex-1-interacting phosphatase isoform X2 n=1 Tax=Cuculus canorus TaxID=55661 RepID=UPI0023AA388C|nr:RNA/RNP complex-1-interacting phosphatase isoform X2 [Cuculus canorus]